MIPLAETLAHLPDSASSKLRVAERFLSTTEKDPNSREYGLHCFATGFLKTKDSSFKEGLKYLQKARRIFEKGGWEREKKEAEILIVTTERELQSAVVHINEDIDEHVWARIAGRGCSIGLDSGGRTFLGKSEALNHNQGGKGGKSGIEIAIAEAGDTLEGLSESENAEEYARISNNLGLLLHTKYSNTYDKESLKNAIDHFQKAIHCFKGAEGGYLEDERATILKNTANALIDLDNTDALAQAVQYFDFAKTIFMSETFLIENVECELMRAAAHLRLAVLKDWRSTDTKKTADEVYREGEACSELLAGRHGHAAKSLKRKAKTLCDDALFVMADISLPGTIYNAIDHIDGNSNHEKAYGRMLARQRGLSRLYLARLMEMKDQAQRRGSTANMSRSVHLHYERAVEKLREELNRGFSSNYELCQLAWAIAMYKVAQFSGTIQREDRESEKGVQDSELDKALKLLGVTSK